MDWMIWFQSRAYYVLEFMAISRETAFQDMVYIYFQLRITLSIFYSEFLYPQQIVKFYDITVSMTVIRSLKSTHTLYFWLRLRER